MTHTTTHAVHRAFRSRPVPKNNDYVVECECVLVLNENERTCIHVIYLFTQHTPTLASRTSQANSATVFGVIKSHVPQAYAIKSESRPH